MFPQKKLLLPLINKLTCLFIESVDISNGKVWWAVTKVMIGQKLFSFSHMSQEVTYQTSILIPLWIPLHLSTLIWSPGIYLYSEQVQYWSFWCLRAKTNKFTNMSQNETIKTYYKKWHLCNRHATYLKMCDHWTVAELNKTCKKKRGFSVK